MRKFNLPKAFRKSWLDALESGKYKQGKKMLYNNNTFCCLGVAGALLGVEKDELQGNNFPNDTDSYKLFPKCLLGSSLSSYAGKLATMNDNGTSFKEIAKYIRKTTKSI